MKVDNLCDITNWRAVSKTQKEHCKVIVLMQSVAPSKEEVQAHIDGYSRAYYFGELAKLEQSTRP